MLPHIINTERLHLRCAGPAWLTYVYEELSEADGMRLLGHDSINTYLSEREKYRGGYAMFNKSFLFFHLLLKGSDAAIGWCGYHTWYTGHDRAEIGYVLTAEGMRGQGYLREAMPAVLHYGFDTMGLNRVEAFVGADNEPSLRLLQRHGFLQEGVLRQHYLVDGIYDDSLLFGLLRHDWKNLADLPQGAGSEKSQK